MRTFDHVLKSAFTLALFSLFLGTNPAFSQSKFIKDLKKAAEESAKRTVERKVEDKTAEKTDEAVEAVFDAPNIFKSKKNSGKSGTEESDNTSESKQSKSGNSNSAGGSSASTGRTISVADQFIPNGQVMYTDNFERDALGDFPSKWETNSGGEIVTVDDFKALRTSGTGFYTPNLPSELPENYAVEFDLFTYNLEYKGTSALRFEIHLVEQPLISKSKKGAGIEMPLWYNGASDYFLVETYGTASKISNKIPFDYTEMLNDIIHFTLIKNGKRVRLFLDETKVIDIPSLASDNLGKYIQFYVREVDLQKDLVVAFANLKITEEGEDLRSKLLKAEGFSTTAILFQTASDQLQPSSFEFLDELGQVLKDDEYLRIQIIGHTDSDGDENSNQILSEKRAMAVANYLTEKFGISGSRFQTVGKGESEPVISNSSAQEKAANRRVEFKKF
ncbi:OmpA family protein [Algoriphagus litoralis]|uniref:OmpA family protein n=1 Tax=Algoriphagus litoralis TaxID=2202829 RepID=UPI000DBAB5F0|nr:OmpA family protein [Algoriphagus litoralis]